MEKITEILKKIKKLQQFVKWLFSSPKDAERRLKDEIKETKDELK